MHKLEYCLFQIAHALENSNKELSKDILYLSSISHNYTESTNEMSDVSEDFMKKIEPIIKRFK